MSWTCSGSSSIPVACIPTFLAASRVVPDPANGSRTVPPGGVMRVTSHSMSASGFTVLSGVLNGSTPHLLEVVADILGYLVYLKRIHIRHHSNWVDSWYILGVWQKVKLETKLEPLNASRAGRWSLSGCRLAANSALCPATAHPRALVGRTGRLSTVSGVGILSMSPNIDSRRGRDSVPMTATMTIRDGTKLSTSAKSAETRFGGPRPVARLGTIGLLTAPWVVVTLTLLAGKCLSVCR